MTRVQWTRKATEQLVAAHEFIAGENATAAAVQVETILRAVEQLVNFPEMGRIGRISHTCELVIPGTPYIVAYRLRGDTIRVLALLHGARRWPTHF